MTKCYFCSAKLTHSIYDEGVYHRCQDCIVKYDLEDVATATVCGKPTYIHMKMRNLKVGVRLNLIAKITEILTVADLGFYEKLIATLPGFPLHPNNIHQKLKLYLLFS